jgi:diguanylate cyclase (GGDEF)-like protein
VVSLLKRKVRKSDKLGRYGGDEIIIILPNCGQKEISKIGERLRLALGNKQIKTDLDYVPISVSVGCATSDLRGIATADGLIKAADGALLKAKGQGRDRVVMAGHSKEPVQERKNA